MFSDTSVKSINKTPKTLPFQFYESIQLLMRVFVQAGSSTISQDEYDILSITQIQGKARMSVNNKDII